MPLTKLHPRDIQRIDWTVRAVEGAPIVHPNETRKRRALMSSPLLRRARVTGISEDADHYMGKLIDAHGGDISPDEPAIDLFCWKYPQPDADIRDYVPPIDAASGESHVPVNQWNIVIGEGEEPESVYIIDFPFCFTCRANFARSRGIRPELPRPLPPGLPGEPGEPGEQEERFRP